VTDKNKEGRFPCSYCGKEFQHPQEADACRDGHNLIYIALSKTDLNRLIQFIQLKNDELLTPTLMKSITKIRRN
jgi:hypothetical protein